MTYDFPVTGYRIVDGDTYHLTVTLRDARSAFRVDLGADTAVPEVRLDGWDCPEKRSSATRTVSALERTQANEAERAASDWLASNLPRGVRVTTQPDPEKYGRWLGRLYCSTGDLGTHLADLHLAVPYTGKTGELRWWQVYDTRPTV